MSAASRAASARAISIPSDLVAYLLGEGMASPVAASAGLKRMVELAPDPSPESQRAIGQFVEWGGVSAVVKIMDAHGERASANADDAVGRIELADVAEQGCILLMNLAGAALAGDAACASALNDQDAVGAVVRSVNHYPESLAADLGEAGLAALMQLSILDLPRALAASVADVVLRGMREPQAGGWLLFLCCRTLSWICINGGEPARQALREADAVSTLEHAVGHAATCEPDCGARFGLEDTLDQLQVVARSTLFVLLQAAGTDGAAEVDEQGFGLEQGVLKVATFFDGDCAVLVGLKARPELNGCGGLIVETGEAGRGPEATSGRYGFKAVLPREKRGPPIKVLPANLRLAPHALAVQIRRASTPASDAAALAAQVTSKFHLKEDGE